MNIPTPLKYIAIFFALAATFYFTYNLGYNSGESNQAVICNKKINAINKVHSNALNKELLKAEQQHAKAITAAKEYWKKNSKQKIVTQTIEKEVIKYVETESHSNSTCKLNDDFLRLWNAAATGSDKTIKSKH